MKNLLILLESVKFIYNQYRLSAAALNGGRYPILYSFALVKPPGHKVYKEPKAKLLKK